MENFFKTITENTSPLVKNIRKHRSILGAFVVLLLAGIFVLFTNIFASGVEVTWDGGGTTNNRSEAANWAGDQLPTSNDTVFFTTLSTKDVAIDTGVNVKGIEIQTGYVGAITQGTGMDITLGASGYKQYDGTFNGGSGNMTINTGFLLNSGSFAAPTGTLKVISMQYGGGAFTAITGTIEFTNTSTVSLSKDLNLYNVRINTSSSTSSVTIANNGFNMNVNNNLTLRNGSLGTTGTITANNTVVVESGFDGSANFSDAKIVTSGSVTITSESGSMGPIFELTTGSTMNVDNGGARLNGIIMKGGTFNGPTGTLILAGINNNTPILEHNSGILNINNGLVELIGNGGVISLKQDLNIDDVRINGTSVSVTNNGFNMNVKHLTLRNGNLRYSTIITATETVLVESGFDGNNNLSTDKVTTSGTVTITAQSGSISPTFELTTGATMTVDNGGATLGGIIMKGGTFNGPTGLLKFDGANLPAIENNYGTLNINNGPIQFDLGNTINLKQNLNLNTVRVNGRLLVTNNGFTLSIDDLTLTDGDIANPSVITATHTVLVESGFDGNANISSDKITTSGTVTITAQSGSKSPTFELTTGATMTVDNGGATLYGLIMKGGTFNGPTGLLRFYGYNSGLPVLENNYGTLNINNGPVEFGGNGTVSLKQDLNITNATINATNLSVTNNGFNMNVTNLTLTNGYLTTNSVVTAVSGVLIQSGFDAGNGQLKINNNNTVLIETGAYTPYFTGDSCGTPGTIRTFTAYTGAKLYFGTNMSINTMNLLGSSTITSSNKTLTIQNYSAPTAPTLVTTTITTGGYACQDVACTTPTNNMQITGDTTLCSGTYTLTGGITVASGNLSIICLGTIMSGNTTNNGFTSTNRSGILLSGCSFNYYSNGLTVTNGSITLINNTFSHDTNAVNLSSVSAFTASNNIIINPGTNYLHQALRFANMSGLTINSGMFDFSGLVGGKGILLSNITNSTIQNISLTGNNFTDQRYIGVYSNNCNNVTINNVQVNNFGINLRADGTGNLTIQNSLSKGAGNAGFNISNSNLTLLNNTSNTDINSISLSSLSSFTGSSNTIINPLGSYVSRALSLYTMSGLTIDNNIFTFSGTITYSKGILLNNITNSVIQNLSFTGNNFTDYRFVGIHSNNSHNITLDNIQVSSFGTNFNADGTGSLIIKNSRSKGAGAAGFSISNSNLNLLNNISDTDINAISLTSLSSFTGSSNIIINPGNSYLAQAFYLSTMSGLTIDNNIFTFSGIIYSKGIILNNITNSTIKDLTLTGSNNSSANFIGVYANNSYNNNIILDNIKIKNFGVNIKTDGTGNLMVKNSTSKSSIYGILASNTNLTLTNNILTNNTYGINLAGVSNLTFYGNTITGNSTKNFYADTGYFLGTGNERGHLDPVTNASCFCQLGNETGCLADANLTGIIDLPICGTPEPVCGNSVVESGEQCDDGNLVNGDGCSAICQIESPLCGTTIFSESFVSDMSQWNQNIIGSIQGAIVNGRYSMTDVQKDSRLTEFTTTSNQHQAKITLPQDFDISFTIKASISSPDQMGEVGLGFLDNDDNVKFIAGLADAWRATAAILSRAGKIGGIGQYYPPIYTQTWPNPLCSGSCSASLDYTLKKRGNDMQVFVNNAFAGSGTLDITPITKLAIVADGYHNSDPFLSGAEISDILITTPPCNICGNGTIETGEVCDDGIHNGEGGYCNLTCTETDTVDIPNTIDTGSIIAEFTGKSYQNATGSITIVPAGTYVGTKRINLANSSGGKIVVPFVLQSSGLADKIEMKAPAGLVVTTTGGIGFTGILNRPEPFTGSVSGISNTLAVVNFSNTQNVPLYFNKPVTFRIPVPGGQAGQIVRVYYSQDGNSRTSAQQVSLMPVVGTSIPYAFVPATHATIFAIVGGGTGSFIINNDDASTTSSGVTLNIYGSGVLNMRFINDSTGGTRSDREPYATGKARVLSTGFGMKTVYAEFDTDNDTGTVEGSTSDDIEYTGGATPPPTTCASGAYCGDLTLRINSGVSYCEYGKTLDFGKTAFSYTTHDLSTGFVTNSGNAKRFCQDNQGLASWDLTIQSSSLVNITTNNSAHTIPAANVYIKNPSAYLDEGICTAAGGTSANNRVAISSATTILGKTSAYGEGCKITTDSLDLKVTLTGAQAIGQYSGTLTINLPNF